MPSVEVQYKDAGALRFLKLLATYFGFKVVENKHTGADESDPTKGQEDGHQHAGIIPGNERRSYEAFLTSKDLDAPTLRRDLWKMS